MLLYERIWLTIRQKYRRLFRRNIELDPEIYETVQEYAAREKRAPEELASYIINEGIRNHQIQAECWNRWLILSPREQQIAALVCLGYTNRQIGGKLYISPETVKTHAEKVLFKFGLPNRQELRILLKDWNFSEFDQ